MESSSEKVINRSAIDIRADAAGEITPVGNAIVRQLNHVLTLGKVIDDIPAISGIVDKGVVVRTAPKPIPVFTSFKDIIALAA